MGETYLHVTSPEVYSKRFSDYVKQFHADDVEDVKGEERRHKSKNPQLSKSKIRSQNPRRMSESSMLPPINTTAGVSTPSFSNGVWKFQTSNPAHGKSNSKTTRSVGQTILLKESQNSPTSRKDGKTLKTTTTSLDIRKSPETLRLTPIIPNDRRYKTEKKVPSKATNENTPRLAPKASNDHHKSKSKVNKNQKLKPFDEPFSIRRKIEQFKRWHEEQYLQKLQKLKQETEIKIDIPKPRASLDKDVPKLKMSDKEGPLLPKTENDNLNSGDEVDSGNGSAFNLSSIMKSTTSRHKSAKTWKTWRDVNDSYAYTDVTKYIEDNELMTPEKETWIKEWADEVDRAYFHNTTSNKNEPLTISET
ncbi:uncharacterized protein LOC126819534 [Patella vulgata]|uniref:uncharacterized protein LOC126819534 n=1 Tax=Patella vulgata TaxID=6465 RepID=UPI00217FD153|nr:uncharacterized protein LOC126819534 [Patella vulgata]